MLFRPVPLLTLAIAIVGANSLILPPIASLVARDLSVMAGDVLQAMGAYGGGTALSALLLAPRADRIGADRVLQQACLVLILALSVSALAQSVPLLILGHALAGIGAGMALPAIYGLAGQIGPKGREKQTIGQILTGWTFSLVAGVVLAASLAELVGWRPIYGGLAGLTALVWLLLRGCEMGVKVTNRTPTSPITGLKVPGIGRALLSNAMLMLGFFGVYSFMGPHVVEVLHRPVSTAGLLTCAYGIGFGLAAFLDRFVDRLPSHLASALAFAGLGLSYLTMALTASHFGGLLLVALIWGGFQHFGLNAIVDRLNRLDPSQRGAIMGLNSASTYACVFSGAFLFRWPYEAAGWPACLAVSVLCTGIALAEALLPGRSTLSDAG